MTIKLYAAVGIGVGFNQGPRFSDRVVSQRRTIAVSLRETDARCEIL